MRASTGSKKNHKFNIAKVVSYECAESSLNKFCAGARFADVTPDFLIRIAAKVPSTVKILTEIVGIGNTKK